MFSLSVATPFSSIAWDYKSVQWRTPSCECTAACAAAAEKPRCQLQCCAGSQLGMSLEFRSQRQLCTLKVFAQWERSVGREDLTRVSRLLAVDIDVSEHTLWFLRCCEETCHVVRALSTRWTDDEDGTRMIIIIDLMRINTLFHLRFLQWFYNIDVYNIDVLLKF